ncbi:hypothetical protein KAFR_0K00640 [Kazachstania africana CBS 2517]|uniref:Guanine nucleotide exchange factor LTE1 n=1 Tax=Kazachstania africana (strain ATCC 22294 / BCRC 22015 / CBS 2517 / CECT 1963 / NBRC 1671 / NRRL Y-8276) TaxID=1071382 RepID=H2B1B9_KAZAF|nr:hypothetical protein KAFR_0K00640 [Kazachstania africana CBS 2517]CCF60419.1 hypothetical protein KAFR_0K00640 [Kazachstania africana CBS 2517]
MNVFSQKNYYPVPSSEVITYRENSSATKRRSVLKSDIYALIVFLSSPEDKIDYSVFSDFFLIYRNFISPNDLYELLIIRFRWCINEISAEDPKRRKIGDVALVRTFVLLRHSMLNHFIEDFLPDHHLRLSVIHFLNEDYTKYPKIITSSIVNLKKAWCQLAKLIWENLHFDEPLSSEYEKWLSYEIKDITTIHNRPNRLSIYAIQGASSPDFRNQSVLSLYKPDETFILPKTTPQKSDKSRRTPTMLLFPQDNSQVPHENNPSPDVTGSLIKQENTHKRTISTNMGHFSKIMKNIEYPMSPEINNIIPPTPAKKVEFILNAFYEPENSTKINELSDRENGAQVDKSPIKLNRSSSSLYKGAVGLLAKWTKNHSGPKPSGEKHVTRSVQFPSSKTEMDTFVKYVISISALSNHNEDINEIISSEEPKFDMLSARTIDEVEYLVTLENDLFQKINESNIHIIPDIKTETNAYTENEDGALKPNPNFSAMDNLDLYQTVNTIAHSVISLSNTLNQSSKNLYVQNLVSPSKIKGDINSSHVSFLTGNVTSSVVEENKLQRTLEYNDGPQKLVFHDSTKRMSGPKDFDSDFNQTKSRFSPTYKLDSSSPLKNVLCDLEESYANTTEDGSNSYVSTRTYDSQLSSSNEAKDNSNNEYNTNNPMADPPEESPALKKKEGFENLREFTFEDDQIVDTPEPMGSLHLDDSKLQTPVTQKISTETAIRQSSGRISIAKRHTATINHTATPIERIESFIAEDPDLMKKEDILNKNERKLIKLEEILLKRTSLTPSVATSKLFNSRPASPNKLAYEHSRVRLSMAPSMQSIVSGSSISTEINYISPPKENNLKERSSNNKLDKGIITTPHNYFFPTDSDDLDNASPEKDFEQLKTKFLNTDTTDSPDVSKVAENRISEFHTELNATAITDAETTEDKINKANLEEIANMPDESMHDDPVTIAMMKLEGIYKKTGMKESKSTPDLSALSKERNLLNITNESPSASVSADKRKSLMLERRRQTIMNIPVSVENTPQLVTPMAEEGVLPGQIQDLIKSYKLQDSRLLVANNTSHIPFILMYDSKTIAEQMTLVERELLTEIDWKDLLNLEIKNETLQADSWLQLLAQNETLSGIDLTICRFNLIVDWIVSEIVLTRDVKMKRNTIQRFIHVAEHCRKFQNYNTLMEIVLALNSVTVQKLVNAWRLIEPGDLLTWEELKKISCLDNNYATIRDLLNSVDPLVGCIPFVAVYLSDLSLNSEKKDWIEDGKIINYSKFDTNVQVVKHFIQRVQWAKFYNFTVDHELLSKCVYISALSPEEIKELSA